MSSKCTDDSEKEVEYRHTLLLQPFSGRTKIICDYCDTVTCLQMCVEVTKPGGDGAFCVGSKTVSYYCDMECLNRATKVFMKLTRGSEINGKMK